MSPRQGKEPRGFLYRLTRFFLVLFLALAAVAGVAWNQRDALKAELAGRVTVRPARFKLDWKSLLHRKCRGEILIQVGNRLPIGVMLQNLRYGIEINGVDVGSGMQAEPRAGIAPLATTTVGVTLYLDAARVGQALALTAPAKVTKLMGHLWDRARGRRPRDPRPLAHLARLQGRASVRLFTGSLELPLDQTVEFNRTM